MLFFTAAILIVMRSKRYAVQNQGITLIALVVSKSASCAMFSESVARKKQKRKDRERKKALVPSGCHLCNGNLSSVKKNGAIFNSGNL